MKNQISISVTIKQMFLSTYSVPSTNLSSGNVAINKIKVLPLKANVQDKRVVKLKHSSEPGIKVSV